jgi:hypothetical protein
LENEQTHFLKEGKAIAQAIGLDARYHDKFAQLFDAQHESLLHLSAEDLRRQQVLETFLAEAILPVEGFVAQAVAAEEVQYRVAHQWHSPHRTFEVGNRQNTFDLTTATAAPGETVLEKITKENLSVRDLEILVAGVKPTKKASKNGSAGNKSPEVLILEEEFQRHLSRRVEIKSAGKRGALQIEYYSPEDFELLCTQLGLPKKNF